MDESVKKISSLVSVADVKLHTKDKSLKTDRDLKQRLKQIWIKDIKDLIVPTTTPYWIGIAHLHRIVFSNDSIVLENKRYGFKYGLVILEKNIERIVSEWKKINARANQTKFSGFVFVTDKNGSIEDMEIILVKRGFTRIGREGEQETSLTTDNSAYQNVLTSGGASMVKNWKATFMINARSANRTLPKYENDKKLIGSIPDMIAEDLELWTLTYKKKNECDEDTTITARSFKDLHSINEVLKTRGILRQQEEDRIVIVVFGYGSYTTDKCLEHIADKFETPLITIQRYFIDKPETKRNISIILHSVPSRQDKLDGISAQNKSQFPLHKVKRYSFLLIAHGALSTDNFMDQNIGAFSMTIPTLMGEKKSILVMRNVGEQYPLIDFCGKVNEYIETYPNRGDGKLELSDESDNDANSQRLPPIFDRFHNAGNPYGEGSSNSIYENRRLIQAQNSLPFIRSTRYHASDNAANNLCAVARQPSRSPSQQPPTVGLPRIPRTRSEPRRGKNNRQRGNDGFDTIE